LVSRLGSLSVAQACGLLNELLLSKNCTKKNQIYDAKVMLVKKCFPSYKSSPSVRQLQARMTNNSAVN
jgi:hypothetical protein